MSAALKVLNLEAIHPNPKRTLVIGDKSFVVPTMTVSSFIELTVVRREFTQAIADGELEKGVSQMVNLVVSQVEGLPKEVVENFTLPQLQSVIAFLFDELPDEALEGGAASSEENEQGN